MRKNEKDALKLTENLHDINDPFFQRNLFSESQEVRDRRDKDTFKILGYPNLIVRDQDMFQYVFCSKPMTLFRPVHVDEERQQWKETL